MDNSMSAMLGAIELYNKPQMAYRDEVTVILIVNAWELALKALLVKKAREKTSKKPSIYYKKRPGEKYRTLSLEDCLNRVASERFWPAALDGAAISVNIKGLSEFRDRAIHLYNTQGLGLLIYSFMQQSILNYRDFMMSVFSIDLAERITWQLLPLGATVPGEAVQFMRVDIRAKMNSEVQDFINDLRTAVESIEAQNGDVGRSATQYDINLHSVKKLASADLVVAIAPDGPGQVVTRTTDPSQTYPFTARQLLDHVNKKRQGRELNTHDYKVLCWKENLRSNRKYAWKHPNSPTCFWSGQAVDYMANLTDAEYDEIRKAYGLHLRANQ